MGKKHWIEEAQQCLEESLVPVPHEVNELDWKVRLSEHKDRLAEHLIASANHPDGGCLVFGVADDGQPQGVDAETVAKIANTLANLGRDAIDPPIAIDHGVVEFRGVPLLFVRVPEHSIKPVHRRGKSVEEAWIRSGGTTRKASRQEVGALMLNSATPRWENLRASPLLSLENVRTTLDLEAVARLLQKPLPTDPGFGSSDITIDRVALALAQFLESLISYQSRFDLATNPMTNDPPDPATVYTPQELRGLEIYSDDCSICHRMQANTNEWQANNGLDEVPSDPGALAQDVRRNDAQGVFRAASLRNIAQTAPYMHDGRFATLRDVINHYDHDVKDSPDLDGILRGVDGNPRRLNLSEEDKDALEAFLHTLTDDAFLTDPKFSDPFQ
jgi:cytochrome c5